MTDIIKIPPKIAIILCMVVVSIAETFPAGRTNCSKPYEFDLTTNILQDAIGNINIGVESKITSRLSLRLSGIWNPWTFSQDVCYKQWWLSPELRLWFSAPNENAGESLLNAGGHFCGIYFGGGQFNFHNVTLPFNLYPKLRDSRYQGWDAGAGLTYGYRFNFFRRFSMEISVAAGGAYVKYDRYRCGRCGERIGSGHKVIGGLSRIGLDLIWKIGKCPNDSK